MRTLVLSALAIVLAMPVSLAQNQPSSGTRSREGEVKRKTMMTKDQEGYTTITKNPPADFPVPAYTGAELKLSDEAVSKMGHQYYVRWYVRASVSDIVNYYVQAMKAQGWKVTDPQGDAKGGANFICTKPTEGAANITVGKVTDVVAGKPVQKSQVVVTVHKK
jgi:hypothetical protein